MVIFQYMKIQIKTTQGENQCLIIPFLKGQVDYELVARLTGVKLDQEFDGSFKSIEKIYLPENKVIYLLGLGTESDAGRWHLPFRLLAFKESKHWSNGITIQTDHIKTAVNEAAALGLQLASYNIGAYKSKQPKGSPSTVHLHIPKANKDKLNKALIIGQTLTEIMKLVDAPGNKKPPEHLGKWAMSSAKKYGYKATVIKGKDLEKEGLHAIQAVGNGSKYPPVLITCEYKPNGLKKNPPLIGLIGKGVTFDTGGLSIKKAQNMHYMKSDMGGAAAVLGTVELAARLKIDAHIVGIVGSAENAVDSESYRPGDVIDSYSGKTIEIIDTDAEGRVILADALAYMIRNFQPHWMIDLATLTGSAVMALGYASGALFTQNDELAAVLQKAGDKVFERLWRMPLYEDFDSEIESDVADVRNLSGKPVAGAITAAKFLEYFTDNHPRWAHLDIAGVAFGDSDFSKMKSASGFGPRLLLEVIEQLT
jgi:leucyl aminopeptidase